MPPQHADKFYYLILTSSTQQAFYKALKYQLDACESKYDSSTAPPICSSCTVRLLQAGSNPLQALQAFSVTEEMWQILWLLWYNFWYSRVYAVHVQFILLEGSESPKATEILKISEGWQRTGKKLEEEKEIATVELGVFSIPSSWNSGTNGSSFEDSWWQCVELQSRKQLINTGWGITLSNCISIWEATDIWIH